MPPGQGYDSWATMIAESAYGTDPGGARDIHVRVIRDTLKKTPNFQPFPGMAGPGIRQRFEGNTVVAGDLELEFHYASLGRLIYWACGASGYAFGADDPVADANTHTIKTGTNQVLQSFTLELARGDTPTGKCFTYPGAVIDQIALEWANQTMVKFTLSIIAKDELTNQTPAETYSPASDAPVLWHNLALATIAGVAAIPMKSGRFAIANNLQKGRFLMSKTISQPLRENNRIVDGSVVSEFEDDAEYAAWAAATSGALAIPITSEEMVTGSTPYALNISAADVQFATVESNVSGPGPLDLPLAFHVNGVNEEVTLTLINGDTTYV